MRPPFGAWKPPPPYCGAYDGWNICGGWRGVFALATAAAAICATSAAVMPGAAAAAGAAATALASPRAFVARCVRISPAPYPAVLRCLHAMPFRKTSPSGLASPSAALTVACCTETAGYRVIHDVAA